MLTKAQITAGLQQAALPQPAAAPVAAPKVSVFAQAKNLLNSVSVNSRTAKFAIGSIVAAAIVVYAGIKFATSTAKKAEEKQKEQKTTDRVIAKMQEARAAAGKAVTLLSARAKQFKKDHPTAVKVIGAAVVAGGVLGVAKLLYKPAAQPSSVANAQRDGDIYFQGDVIDFDDNRDYARGTMHEQTYGSVEDTTDSFELDANQLAVKDKFKNDVFYNTASTRAELAACMEKFNRENGQTVIKSEPAPVATAPIGVEFDPQASFAAQVDRMNRFYEPKTDIGGGREYVHPEHNDNLPSLSNPAPEGSLESGNSTEDREYPVKPEATREDQLNFLDKLFGLPKGGFLKRLKAEEAASSKYSLDEMLAKSAQQQVEAADAEVVDTMMKAYSDADQARIDNLLFDPAIKHTATLPGGPANDGLNEDTTTASWKA